MDARDITSAPPSLEVTSMRPPSSSSDHEPIIRGRKRDRSMTRPSASVRAIRCTPSDESRTMRGRSRTRRDSPMRGPETASQLLARLRGHCPSRVPQELQVLTRPPRRQRTRSRSRGPQFDLDKEAAASRAGEAMSGLRNEFRAELDAEKEPEEET